MAGARRRTTRRALNRALLFSPARRLTPERLGDFFLRLWRLSRLVHQRFRDDRCTRAAGALSFTTLIALVPLLAVVFAVLSVFPVYERWMDVVLEFTHSNFVPAAGEAVAKYLKEFTTKAAHLTVWGMLFVLVTALFMMATIERSFNDIWHVQRPRRRLHRLIGYWAVLTLGPVLVAAGLSLGAYVHGAAVLNLALLPISVRAVLDDALPYFFETLAFVLLYMAGPNVSVRFRHALSGGLFAALMFEIAKGLFAAYIGRYANYQQIYGAIAVLPVFLLWVYISWTIVLLGAVLTASLPEWRRLGKPTASLSR
jgi:membrane protein